MKSLVMFFSFQDVFFTFSLLMLTKKLVWILWQSRVTGCVQIHGSRHKNASLSHLHWISLQNQIWAIYLESSLSTFCFHWETNNQQCYSSNPEESNILRKELLRNLNILNLFRVVCSRNVWDSLIPNVASFVSAEFIPYSAAGMPFWCATLT